MTILKNIGKREKSTVMSLFQSIWLYIKWEFAKIISAKYDQYCTVVISWWEHMDIVKTHANAGKPGKQTHKPLYVPEVKEQTQ